jgi:transposase
LVSILRSQSSRFHGADVDGAVVIRKRVSRAKVLEFFSTLPACVVGIEACPSAHHWSRELLALGHTVRLMPPSYVKAYLKRSKREAVVPALGRSVALDDYTAR